ncbi:tagatose kinase [Lichenihabitans psoromatis]|uniref:tagatose kinase n=1 Tax=Lichenihabitans psoromatis TaxID=2528642 RepID=UPI0010360163|nr:sugar kinase [Lichenihabitans psoromatis]
MKTVVTIGEIVVEIMALDRGFGFGEPLRLSGPYPSGAPAIFIDQVARLGQPCAIVSCVGDDDFGRMNRARLATDGVDVSAIAIDPEAATGSAFVRYRPDGARDFVFNIKHSACGLIALTDAGRRVMAGCDHLHVMGSSLFAPAIVAATEAAIETVKERGGTVSFDPNVRKEMLDLPGMREAFGRVLAKTDLFLPSGPELFLFADAADEMEAAQAILTGGVSCIVVKQGADGARCHVAGRVIDQPAFTAREIDPTGAGDCFGATFVTAWLRGWPLERALALAAASGARAVERQGPMEGVSTLDDLERLVEGAPAST